MPKQITKQYSKSNINNLNILNITQPIVYYILAQNLLRVCSMVEGILYEISLLVFIQHAHSYCTGEIRALSLRQDRLGHAYTIS